MGQSLRFIQKSQKSTQSSEPDKVLKDKKQVYGKSYVSNEIFCILLKIFKRPLELLKED